MSHELTNKKPVRAVALRHDSVEAPVPKVLAKGEGDLAQRIMDMAAKEDIPVREDRDLVELLTAVDVGQEIPLELYEAVAAFLAFLYQLNGSGQRTDGEK